MTKIGPFRGAYRYLSNFWPATVLIDGVPYLSVEYAYQAAKTLDTGQRRRIQRASDAAAAKRLGRRVTIRPDWESQRVEVMLDLLRQKFRIDDLRVRLLATEDAYIEEENTWGDKFWGVVDGEGQNNLGRLIMRVRTELRVEQKLLAWALA